jgi:hypothetical protein
MNQSFITREKNVQDAGCESPMHILPIKIANNRDWRKNLSRSCIEIMSEFVQVSSWSLYIYIIVKPSVV